MRDIRDVVDEFTIFLKEELGVAYPIVGIGPIGADDKEKLIVYATIKDDFSKASDIAMYRGHTVTVLYVSETCSFGEMVAPREFEGPIPCSTYGAPFTE